MNGLFNLLKSHNHLAYLHNNRLPHRTKSTANHFRKIFHHDCSRANLHLAQNLRNNGRPPHLIHMISGSLRSSRLYVLRARASGGSLKVKMQPKVKFIVAVSSSSFKYYPEKCFPLKPKSK